NPDKLLFPEAGLTKRDLALYFVTIASWIVPHLYERPLTLLRCPDGWNKPCFYQKHADDNVPGAITRVTVRDSEGPSLYMMANSTSAVVALVQMGALEIHPWGSRTPKLGRPDRIIFDLDPDEAVGWDEISEAAKVMKTLLDHLGLRVFLKTTGGKGLHLVIPIRPTQPWKEIKGFSQSVAQLLVNTFPDRFTAKILRASRRGKIFIDYLRNAEGATAIAPYSIRARAHAPIATPIDWSELASDVRFDHFKVANLPARLNTLKSDPWADLTTIKQSVTRAMMKAVGYRR
ncbi:MAG TPA: non-homologous end-joining DNA ligase, partial [Terriglobales bacterium]|nr:non-homologous end-joining DNA ligase [Terriglobales bacterium]